MSFTIPAAAAITAATAPMVFEAADTTVGATKDGQALLWGDLTGYATYIADSASTQAEVTALTGYTAAFTYTMDVDMTSAANAPSVDESANTTATQTYGVCFQGSETDAAGTTVAGTSCAGVELTYTAPDNAGGNTISVDAAYTYLYAP